MGKGVFVLNVGAEALFGSGGAAPFGSVQFDLVRRGSG